MIAIIYVVFLLIYFGIYAYYIYGILMQAMRARKANQRFTTDHVMIILLLSLVTVVLAAFPFKKRIVRFVTHNGIVNLYINLVFYFFEPYSEHDFSYELSESE